MMRTDAGRHLNWAGATLWVCVGAGTLLLVGCERPLLSPDDQRAPFERYDAVRSQYAQRQIEDEFGRPKPNLRARLAPKD